MAKKYDTSKRLRELGVSGALPDSLEVMTPDGTKTVESLKVGDTIFSADGTPTKVTSVEPMQVFSMHEPAPPCRLPLDASRVPCSAISLMVFMTEASMQSGPQDVGEEDAHAKGRGGSRKQAFR